MGAAEAPLNASIKPKAAVENFMMMMMILRE